MTRTLKSIAMASLMLGIAVPAFAVEEGSW